MARTDADVFPTADHNHGSCETELLMRAEKRFKARGMKMTELRRRVLTEIAASHEALGAYDILERLAAKGPRLAPISVYRAIEALHEAGVVHRLETRNAFFACHSSHAPERDQLILACDHCGQVAEVAGDQIFSAMQAALERADFKATRAVTEVSGTCAACRQRLE